MTAPRKLPEALTRLVSPALPVDDPPHDRPAAPHICPTRIVAQGYSTESLPFGLDKPLELRGGDRLGPDGVPAMLPFDWHDELLRLVTMSCRERRLTGDRWFSLPPILLAGRSGIGRIHIARQIARLAGVPHAVLDLSAWDGGAVHPPIRRLDVREPSCPVIAMAASGCANPIISVTGFDIPLEQWGKPKPGYRPPSDAAISALAAMIDPASNRFWAEQAMAATIDLSAISWIIHADEPDALSFALPASLHRIALDAPPEEMEDPFLLNILVEAMNDWNGGGLPDGFPTFETLEEMYWIWKRDQSVNDVYAVARTAILAGIDSS